MPKKNKPTPKTKVKKSKAVKPKAKAHETASLREIHVHVLSDSTGETAHRIASAALSQFPSVKMVEHNWPLVRTPGQIEKMLSEAKQGHIVLATFADSGLEDAVKKKCLGRGILFFSVLQPLIKDLGDFLGVRGESLPGRQHMLDKEYFDRIEAIDFALHHDDGQKLAQLQDADIILVGVSRTSKTPTCVYLSHRGVRAANVPVVPGVPLPQELFSIKGPLIVGLTNDPERLAQIRTSRVQLMGGGGETYADVEQIKKEVLEAKRIFARENWPVIDVTRKSVEETAAVILQIYQNFKQKSDAGNV